MRVSMEKLVDRQVTYLSDIAGFADGAKPYQPVGLQVGHSGAAVFLSEVAEQRNDGELREVAASHLRSEAAFRNTAPLSLFVGLGGTIASICLSKLIHELDLEILAARLAHSPAAKLDTIAIGDLVNGAAGLIIVGSALNREPGITVDFRR